MISKLTISNFQNHKKSELEFASGVNVIVGSSDSGKTAILRSINWVVNNKPGGDSIIRKGEKECSVIIDEIEKRKGKENLYFKGKEEYRAFGTNVPEDIQKYFNFSELNMQQQLDSPFLLSNSSGEVARFLNKIVNLDSIDLALKNIDSKKREVKKQIDFNDLNLTETREKLKSFPDLDSIAGFITTIELVNDKLKADEIKKEEIKELVFDYENITKQHDSIEIPDIDIDSLIVENNKTQVLIEKKFELDKLISSIEDINEKIKTVPDIDIDSLIVENDLILKEVTTKYILAEICETTIHLQHEIKGNKIILINMENKFKKLMPGHCPLCGSII